MVQIIDVKNAISKLKADKTDEGGILLSNNFICGTNILHFYLSLLFTSMISHCFAPIHFFTIIYDTIAQGCES